MCESDLLQSSEPFEKIEEANGIQADMKPHIDRAIGDVVLSGVSTFPYDPSAMSVEDKINC